MLTNPISFDVFQTNVLRFIDRCGVAAGVADIAAWNAAGETFIYSDFSIGLVRPFDEQMVSVNPLEKRMETNDWAFASTPGGCESLEGGHSAVEALYLLGELDRLSADNKRAWVDYFNQYQDKEIGYYLGPYVPPREHRSWQDGSVCKHPWYHMHDHLVSSLCPTMMLLGGKSRYPLSQGSQTGRFLDKGYLENFLHGRDWNNYKHDLNFRRNDPWWMGNEFWFPACILWQISVWETGTPAAQQARTLLDDVWYKWHDSNFCANGFWAGDLDGDKSLIWHGSREPGYIPTDFKTPDELYWSAMTIMGGAHQLWFYDFDQHPIPDDVRRAQTDALLALLNKHNHHFGMGDIDNPTGWACNCTDVDCMTILAINWHRQNYRRDDISTALLHAMYAILCDRLNDDGVLESIPGAPFTHNFNSWETFSPAGRGNMLNQSFYLWAIIAACVVNQDSDNFNIQSFVKNSWPHVPSHWLWLPEKQGSNHE